MQETFVAQNLEEMEKIAANIAERMSAGEVWGFSGDLGAGKTTLVQMVGRRFGIRERMTSPTFVLRKEYTLSAPVRGIARLVHIDAYRIEGGSAEDLGEMQEKDAVTCVEWPEKLGAAFQKNCISVHVAIGANEERTITIEK